MAQGLNLQGSDLRNKLSINHVLWTPFYDRTTQFPLVCTFLLSPLDKEIDGFKGCLGECCNGQNGRILKYNISTSTKSNSLLNRGKQISYYK